MRDLVQVEEEFRGVQEGKVNVGRGERRGNRQGGFEYRGRTSVSSRTGRWGLQRRVVSSFEVDSPGFSEGLRGFVGSRRRRGCREESRGSPSIPS